MACDLCGAVGTSLADLLDGYKTEHVKAVCPKCESTLNDHLRRIRDVQHGLLRQLMRRYLTNRHAERMANSSTAASGVAGTRELLRNLVSALREYGTFPTKVLPALKEAEAALGVQPTRAPLAEWLRRMAGHFIAEGGFQGGAEVADMLRWAEEVEAALGVNEKTSEC